MYGVEDIQGTRTPRDTWPRPVFDLQVFYLKLDLYDKNNLQIN